ncbi:18S rRNA maturation protein [Ceratobasidium sp. 414]|nr:18S rRNA maturation protein [Ceratobasidium sp. 414]
MPPSRTRDSNAKDKHSAEGKRERYRKKSNPDEPGVQKLKSSLRQTRRLLAKDDLAPDVRIQTERRLKSLEADLAKAEIRRKERSMAVRYHKLFRLTDVTELPDKRKVTRKIDQTKRALEAPELEKKERKKLQRALLGHRVDLNYILNYPKLAKYVSLYPSTTTGDADTTETDRLREERRAAVRQAMERGEMDAEPEMMKKAASGTDEEQDDKQEGSDEESEEEPAPVKPTSKSHRSTKPRNDEPKPREKKSKSRPTSAPAQQIVNVQDDDFFDI